MKGYTDMNTESSRRESSVFDKIVIKQLGANAVNDEQRVSNINLKEHFLVIREHFLITLYVWSRFRTIREEPQMGDLVDFHASHKLLFLAYNQSHFRTCGRITANHEKLPVETVFQLYEEELTTILAKPFRRQSMVNTLQHAYGWISKSLSDPERQYILNTIEEYRDERIPIQAVTKLIEAHAIRFQQDYLLSQILLRSFPLELTDLSDNGKGRIIQ